MAGVADSGRATSVKGNRPKSRSPNFIFKLYQADMFRGSSCTQTTGVLVGERLQGRLQLRLRQRMILLQPHDRHVRMTLVADLQQFIVYLAAAQQHAAGLLVTTFGSAITR